MDSPFSISPNPANLYLTPSLKAVLHKVRFTVDRRQGLTCVLGDVGMGKSSVLRLLYGEYASRGDTLASLIPTPSFASDFAFLKAMSGEFDILPKRSLYDQEHAFREFLVKTYQSGNNVVFFIDEAQRLNPKMLELIRTMLNFETNQAKLVQFVLAGQIELREHLLDPSKKAIRSRIFAPSTLDPLTLGEARAMVAFRCEHAEIENPFTDQQIDLIYEASGGVPREILKICHVAHELSVLRGEKTVSSDTVSQAIGEAVLHV